MRRVLATAMLALSLTLPGDGNGAVLVRGPLTSALLHIEATPESRTETVVDRFASASAAGIDETRSLAGDADVFLLAAALDAAGADRAAFTTDVFRFRDDRGALLPYRALAVGTGARATGSVMIVGITMKDGAAAREQAARVDATVRSGVSVAARRRWSDVLAVERIDVRGRVVVAVLPTTVNALWIDLERHPDTLLWWH